MQEEEHGALRTENARLKALLDAHGIEWRLPQEPTPQKTSDVEPSNFSANEKVALFRRLFRGRTDVYPIRWESKTTGKTGYVPACGNEWLAGVCGKPRIKCADCNNRLLSPLSDTVIYEHLAGKCTVGVYPLLTDDTCHFLAADFDEADWKEDALAFIQSCHNWVYRLHSKFHAQVRGLMLGFSSPAAYLPAMLGDWVPLSLAIPALAHDSSSSNLTTVFSPIRTRCLRGDLGI